MRWPLLEQQAEKVFLKSSYSLVSVPSPSPLSIANTYSLFQWMSSSEPHQTNCLILSPPRGEGPTACCHRPLTRPPTRLSTRAPQATGHPSLIITEIPAKSMSQSCSPGLRKVWTFIPCPPPPFPTKKKRCYSVGLVLKIHFLENSKPKVVTSKFWPPPFS